MKLHLLSDLHLEFLNYHLENSMDADVLILAGDITIAQALHDHSTTEWSANLSINQLIAARTRSLFAAARDQFKHVIMVAGNHEFYHGKIFAGIDYLKEECDKFNITFLENDRYQINDTLFLGSTLWTDFHKSPKNLHLIKDCMNDYSVIRNDKRGYRKLLPIDTLDKHTQSLKFLKKEIETTECSQVVVISHHAPSSMSIDPYYRHDSNNEVENSAYYSDLSNFILDHPKIKVWCHGHTHYPISYHIGDTIVLSNAKGYQSAEDSAKSTGFNPTFIHQI